jgi:uncharacterized membrane protein YgcG
MRPDSTAWERAAEVCEAVEGWLRVGAIDTSTGDAIRAAFPDPCVRPSRVWRALTAGTVTAVVVCALGALLIASRPGETGLQVLLLLFAGASFIATELLDASPRFARRGAAGATSLWAGALLLAGFGLILLDTMKMRHDIALDVVLIAGVLVWGASCWRWGNPLYAAFSAISLFLFLGRLPQGRLLWVLVGAALAGIAASRLDEVSWAPSHRRAAAVVVVTGLTAAYAAVNVYSLDEHLLENLLRLAPMRPALPRPSLPPGLFAVSALATAMVPLVVLVWGAKSRRTFLLDTGIVLLVASLVTLRHYVHIAPLWVILTVSGAVLVAMALAVERTLRRNPGEEIWGFTADPLFSDEKRQQALQIVPVVAAFTSAAPGQAAEEKGFTAGGGRFGGGGATEKF